MERDKEGVSMICSWNKNKAVVDFVLVKSWGMGLEKCINSQMYRQSYWCKDLTVHDIKIISRNWHWVNITVKNSLPFSLLGCRGGSWTPICTVLKMIWNTDYSGERSTPLKRRVRDLPIHHSSISSSLHLFVNISLLVHLPTPPSPHTLLSPSLLTLSVCLPLSHFV